MWTIDAGATAVLSLLVDGQRRVLGVDLVGSYLFGSAATRAFEPGVSDVDTVAVLRSDPTETQHAGLDELHAGIVREMPEWADRVEAVYLSKYALANFRTTSSAARISPGEPFHPIEVDDRWLIDWYQLRTIGIALHGPPVTQVVPPITQGEYVEAVRRYLLDPDWLDATVVAEDRSYAILTMCRGFRTCRTGEYVSKREGARWASEVMPGHAALITDALAWRGRPEDRSRNRNGPSHEAALHLVMDVQRRLE